MKLPKLILAAASSAAILAFVTAPNAAHAADEEDRVYTSSIYDHAYAEFHSDGDYFYLCDTSFDFLEVYLEYRYIKVNGTLQTGTHRNPGSFGDCLYFTHDFGEGREVRFRACVDNVTPVADDCDAWRRGVA
jgi:hypothetical protein